MQGKRIVLRLADLSHVISVAKRMLGDADVRLCDDVPLSVWECLPDQFPHAEARFKKSYDQDENAVVKDFWEEVNAIADALDTCNVQIPVPEWLDSDRNRDFGRRLQRDGIALQLWDWYAIPVRFRGGGEGRYSESGLPPITILSGHQQSNRTTHLGSSRFGAKIFALP